MSRRTLRLTRTLLAILALTSANRIFALDPTSRISQYGHSVWRVQDGYFGGAPWAITQTGDGYIWVGTQAGLYQFDGVRFVRWSAPSGEQLPSSSILSLLAARDGSLWIGTDAGLAHLLNNRLILYQKNEGWLITNIVQDKDERIWIRRFRTDDKTHTLCQVIDAAVRCYGSEDGLDVFAGSPLVQDPSGDLWVGGSTTLVRWRPGASKVYRPQSLQSNENNGGISSLSLAPDGSLWVGMSVTGRGAGLQRMVSGTLKPYFAPKLNGESLDVITLGSDHQNSLWVGTTQGIYRVRGMDVDHYGSSEGLSGDVVRSIFEDREGNVWVATPQGLDMFRDLRVKSISKREGLKEDDVSSIAASRDGKIWIGADHLHVLESHGLSSDIGNALPGHTVTSLFVDHADRLWVGMVNRLFVRNQGSFRQITKSDGGATGMVAGIAEDSEHDIWAQTFGPPGTLFRIRNFKIVQELRSPEVPLARKIVGDTQGGVWLGLVTGDLARYHDGQVNVIKFGDHPNSRVQAIAQTSDGAILGGTAFGVIAWKNGKQQTLTIRNGLPCNGVNGVISDDAGDLWLYAQCGLVEIASEQMQLWWAHPDSKLSVRAFDAFDGVRPGLGYFNTSTKAPDQRLWFANGSVAQVIDPTHIPKNALAPPVHINGLIADSKGYALESGIRLPPLTHDLEIDYTALSYVVPQRVRFRYMLEGRDPGWQDPGTRREAFYNDLQPRHYRFHVIACNNDGVWNETGASLEFVVLPTFYQTTWFRLMCVAASLVLLWAIYRFRLLQLQRQFAIGLEARVDERTRIARNLHDTLLQSFNALLLRLQTVSNVLPGRPDEAKRRIDGAIEQASQAIREGRDAVHELRSGTLSAIDLGEAISSFAKELLSGSTAEPIPEIRVEIQGKPGLLNPMTRDEVFRVAAEVLRNAIRHAHPRQIEVELRYDEHQLGLRIRDDGKGIDPVILSDGRSLGHWGLHGMQERAKLLGGTLEVRSQIDIGTEIEMKIPAAAAYAKPPSLPRSVSSLFRPG